VGGGEVPGHAAEQEHVGDAVGDGVEEGAPLAGVVRRLGQGPVEQVRQGGQHTEDEAAPQASGGDHDGGGDGEYEAGEGEVVGGEPGAAQAVTDRLPSPFHGGPNTPVEHGDQVTCPACGLRVGSYAAPDEPSVACPDTRAPGGSESA